MTHVLKHVRERVAVVVEGMKNRRTFNVPCSKRKEDGTFNVLCSEACSGMRGGRGGYLFILMLFFSKLKKRRYAVLSCIA